MPGNKFILVKFVRIVDLHDPMLVSTLKVPVSMIDLRILWDMVSHGALIFFFMMGSSSIARSPWGLSKNTSVITFTVGDCLGFKRHTEFFLSLFIYYCTAAFIEVQQSAVKSTQPRVNLGYMLVKGVDFDQSLLRSSKRCQGFRGRNAQRSVHQARKQNTKHTNKT